MAKDYINNINAGEYDVQLKKLSKDRPPRRIELEMDFGENKVTVTCSLN